MHVREFQDLIARKYKERDLERGVSRTFMWFIEEVEGGAAVFVAAGRAGGGAAIGPQRS